MVRLSHGILKPALRIFLCILCLAPLAGSAQQVLLSRNVLADTIKPRFGQNMRNFVHVYGGLGMMAGNSSAKGADMVYVMSPNLDIGVRYKLKIARYYAIGAEFSYNLYSYKIMQDAGKIFPDTIRHDAERIIFSNLSMGFYNRISLGKTGNYIGKFIDLGVYGDWIHYADHFTRDKLENGNIERIHTSGLSWVKHWQYGVYAHFGITRYVLFVKYRLSDLFDDNYNYPELPRWTVGLQIGIHKVN
jgi:hypothetical protein